MNYDKMTVKVQDALQSASALAQQKDHSEIGTEHVLYALLTQEGGIVAPIVERIGAACGASANLTRPLSGSARQRANGLVGRIFKNPCKSGAGGFRIKRRISFGRTYFIGNRIFGQRMRRAA